MTHNGSPPGATRDGVTVDIAHGRSLGQDAWRRLRKNRFAMFGLAVFLLLALACFLLPVLFKMDYGTTTPSRAWLSPLEDGAGIFGTDGLGRDYLARVLKGGQISIMVGIVATLVSIVIGVLYGSISGYFGGKVDEVMMRIVDFLYGIPYMFLVILIMLMFGKESRGEALPIFVGLGLVQWLTMARIVRGQVLTLRNQDFIEAAKAIGVSDARILRKHIIPNLLGVVIVFATLTVPAVIILESFLSYLGLGVELSWGKLVSEAVKVVNPINSYWWLLFFPSLFLGLTLFCLNFFGDGLSFALDPKSKR